MIATPINFFKEEIKFRLSHQDKLRGWVLEIIKKKKYVLSNLNFIFCSDRYLKNINREYLKHDYFTDIITFDNSVLKKTIDGDVFISIDRVRINSKKYNTSFEDELHRVMAHGVLHLLGYRDKNKSQKAEMKKMEDRCLLKRSFRINE